MRIGFSWQWCAIATLSAAMLSAGILPAGSGYLARIGPGPLRFHSTFQADPAVVLPALKMADENPTAPIELAASTNESPANQIDLSAGPDIDFQFLPPELVAPLTDAELHGPYVPQGGAMVPQMLLRYFTRGPNQPQAIISAPFGPIEFSPPPPPLTRSSAVYISK